MMAWQLFNGALQIQPLAEEPCNLLITGRGSGSLCGFVNSCAATAWEASEGQECAARNERVEAA